MLERLLHFSINQRWVILGVTSIVALIGLYNLLRLPIDAVPDITNVQVQINSEAEGYSPLEVEQRITFPIEAAISGLPGLSQTRSLSRYGLSQVTVVFEDGTNIYFARQLVSERLQEAKSKLPSGVEPALGPISTGLGEIYMWSVKADKGAKKPNGDLYTITDLREIQDWIIKPQLRNVKGVTEVNTIGGMEKQYQVSPNPNKMIGYNITLSDVVTALEKNNSNVGAGYIERKGEQYLIRAPGQISTIDEVGKIVVKHHKGVPVFVKDVAEIGIGKEQRTGAATQDGNEVVIGTAFMLLGENSRIVSKRVDEKMSEIRKGLPPGVKAETTYNRTILVDKTIWTIEKNLLEGAILVIVILFLFLGNMRAALITAMVIPLSMLFTAIGMVSNKISGNLMSLGALDFGIIVDGAVIIVENCIARLAHAQHAAGRHLNLKERLELFFDATKEVRQATMFGELIIMIVYLPILTLTGVEGKMFTPMALTVVFALFGAMILSVTFVPAAVAIFLKGDVQEKENVIMRHANTWYRPAYDFCMNNKKLTLTAAAMLVLVSSAMAFKSGTEFIPSLDEGDIATHAMRIPGTSLTQAIEMQKVLEKTVVAFPEVQTVFSKIGTAEIASDPMPPNVADTFIMLKPKSEWPGMFRSKADLIASLEEKLEGLPGNQYEFTQPIQMRFNELISGVRSDVAVKIFGDDMDELLRLGQKTSGVLQGVSGASDVKVEQISGLPVLNITPDRNRLSQSGLNVADVQEVVNIALGGKASGKIFEGDRRFDLLVRLSDDVREDVTSISHLPIVVPDDLRGNATEAKEGRSNYTTLGSVSKIEISEGPNQISREDGKRRLVVSANVRGRDLGSFVEEAQSKLDKDLEMPSGYWVKWGGQFEQLLSASARLKIVVPFALLMIFLLLYISFRSVRFALLVFSGVPLALTGGMVALWIRGIPLSISAGVGFIALSGVAVLNGLVMITFINKLIAEGMPLDEAIRQGSFSRLRPVLMTALVASLGFVPMALATGTGAEVQRPLATVVIGGIISSTILTLAVLPVLYKIFDERKKKQLA